jgi:hypothetical protein
VRIDRQSLAVPSRLISWMSDARQTPTRVMCDEARLIAVALDKLHSMSIRNPGLVRNRIPSANWGKRFPHSLMGLSQVAKQ